jgi:hypothetical protein
MIPRLRITTPFDYDDRDPRAKMIRETSAFLSLILGDPELLRRVPHIQAHRADEGKLFSRGFRWLYYNKLFEYLRNLNI